MLASREDRLQLSHCAEEDGYRRSEGQLGWTRVGKTYVLNKNRVLGFLKVFLGFDLQMPDTKLRPTSTMKSKDKSSEQRFGHVNASSRNSYLNIIFIIIFIFSYTISEKLEKPKIRTFESFSLFKNLGF